MKDYSEAQCKHMENGKHCDLPPNAHGIDPSRGTIVSHGFVLGVTLGGK